MYELFMTALLAIATVSDLVAYWRLSRRLEALERNFSDLDDREVPK